MLLVFWRGCGWQHIGNGGAGIVTQPLWRDDRDVPHLPSTPSRPGVLSVASTFFSFSEELLVSHAELYFPVAVCCALW